MVGCTVVRGRRALREERAILRPRHVEGRGWGWGRGIVGVQASSTHGGTRRGRRRGRCVGVEDRAVRDGARLVRERELGEGGCLGRHVDTVAPVDPIHPAVGVALFDPAGLDPTELERGGSPHLGHLRRARVGDDARVVEVVDVLRGALDPEALDGGPNSGVFVTLDAMDGVRVLGQDGLRGVVGEHASHRGECRTDAVDVGEVSVLVEHLFRQVAPGICACGEPGLRRTNAVVDVLEPLLERRERALHPLEVHEGSAPLLGIVVEGALVGVVACCQLNHHVVLKDCVLVRRRLLVRVVHPPQECLDDHGLHTAVVGFTELSDLADRDLSGGQDGCCGQ